MLNDECMMKSGHPSGLIVKEIQTPLCVIVAGRFPRTTVYGDTSEMLQALALAPPCNLVLPDVLRPLDLTTQCPSYCAALKSVAYGYSKWRTFALTNNLQDIPDSGNIKTLHAVQNLLGRRTRSVQNWQNWPDQLLVTNLIGRQPVTYSLQVLKSSTWMR